MGLQSFENGFERIVSGVFSRGSRGRVTPIELGRRLLREIDDHRSVDNRGRRIVPNAFTFLLCGVDLAAFFDFEDNLRDELCETAREYARSEGFEFVGPVTVSLSIDDDLRPGRFVVTSRMKEGPGGAARGALVLPSGDRLQLTQNVVTVGRMPDCTVPVNDVNVSRRHCEIRPSGSGYVVVDLGSTNGTKLNGVRIDGEQYLSGGDIVSVGNTHLRFEAS